MTAPVCDPNARMRAASGEVDSTDPLVSFLYVIGRDHLPPGVIEGAARETGDRVVQFTNGWLAQWAIDLAGRLRPEGVTWSDGAEGAR